MIFGFWDKGEDALLRRPFERRCYDSWQKYGSGRRITIFDSVDLERLMLPHEKELLMFCSAQQLSDLARMKFLHAYGGIYMDVSVLLTEDLDSWLSPLLDQHEVVGFEAKGPMWTLQSMTSTSPSPIMENWFLAVAQKNSPFIASWCEIFTTLLLESISSPYELALKDFGTKTVCRTMAPDNSKTWTQHEATLPRFVNRYLTMHTAFLPAYAAYEEKSRIYIMSSVHVWSVQQTPPSKLLKFNRSGRQHIEIFAPRSVHRLILRHSGTALEEPRLVYFILSLLLCAMLALPFPLMWLPRTGLWWVLVVLFVLVALTALLFLAFHLG